MRRRSVADRLGQQFGNYRLVSLLGQGGYAEVYLGQHVRFKQQAAIKVLHAHLSKQEAEHFQQEAETIATLAHPGIIRVLDFDVEDGVPFLVMDYAQGGSLRQRYPKGSLVPLPVIISSVKQVAEALQYAHEQKFIHRDVKPENMLVGKRQEVLLSDFGIATIVHSTSSLSTSAEGTSGTLAYMAPEQIEGHPRAASDQYALGVVVYEWLCGERPFEGSVSELIAQQLSMPPLPLRERIPTIAVEVEQVVLRALAKDPKERFASVADFATALERASQRALTPTAQLALELSAPSPVAAPGFETLGVAPGQPAQPTETTPSADLPVGGLEPTVYPAPSAQNGHDTPHDGAPSETPQAGQVVLPTAAVVSPPLEPTMPVKQKTRHLPRLSAALLIGLAVVIIAGGILGSVSLLARFGVIGAQNTATTAIPVRGGTWTDDFWFDPDSFIPNGSTVSWLFSIQADQALYLPLFYGDAQGVIHPGAASEVPSIQNGGVNADATTWTFHLRPHLVWSDGAPYDARDVDYTWKLWTNPKFGAASTYGLDLISSTDVSADHLAITFHLKRPFAPFLADLWVDGFLAPLPAHHFNSMAPQAVLKSPENLNPKVVSGPFMMAESVPGSHYTLVRNPRYYRASEGLPYLDKLVFNIVNRDAVPKDLQAGTITSSWRLDYSQEYQRLTNYTLVASPTSADFEGLFFNFHNQVLASHQEVRKAMAMAINQQALINGPLHGFASPLCTDHGSAYHPGYDPNAQCPIFDVATANKLLDDNGWVKGPDGVRSKGGQRLEFEYSTTANSSPRLAIEPIIQRDMQQIGIKLDIQNYPPLTFFSPFLTEGKASPGTGAVAGRYDIAEFAAGPGYNPNGGYDPDDSSLLSCDQFPPNGYNFDFYCNPALDALYQQEQATPDPGERQQLFFQIHQIYLTDFPFITLYSSNDLAMVRKGTHNYLPSAIEGETINIWQWWCDRGKC
jgi:ABC-type transport system substrate-binding protein/serine/threonine protein kinase